MEASLLNGMSQSKKPKLRRSTVFIDQCFGFYLPAPKELRVYSEHRKCSIEIQNVKEGDATEES